VGATLGISGISPNVLVVLVGALLVLIGNYLPKIRKNFFLGIRTPWTLASDEVWLRTHRFGGWVFTIGGIAIVIFGLLGSALPMVVVLVAVALAPIAYSFVAYKNLEGFANGGNGSPASD
ncbi:MAG: SdpI family protein, partial [Candidatus Eremiobacteraeota bacterium]|nr:SdpI family protein [Candidatus Eremiobacteraeota bacterium]